MDNAPYVEVCEHYRIGPHLFGDDCPMNPGCDCICPGGRIVGATAPGPLAVEEAKSRDELLASVANICQGSISLVAIRDANSFETGNKGQGLGEVEIWQLVVPKGAPR